MQRRLGIRAWGLLAATMVVAVAVGCRSTPKESVTNGPADADPGVVHIHGLGINPQDGALFAATHTGLFRLPEQGAPERIAGRYQDTMGFTVVGANRFLGSGHPDLRDFRAGRLPSLLGLIESTDAGQTWQARSLQGTVDFHALRTAQGRIYGYDSTGGALMVSADSTTWQTLLKAPMRDFAVSPADPDLIVAVMANDLRRSRDGGRTWEPLAAPPLTLLTWDASGGLWGVTATGAVFQGADGGGAWTQAGSVGGQPEALLSVGGSLYVAVSPGSILISDNGGKDWRLRYKSAG